MDKNLIKKYAVWAREELIKRVSTKAQEYGITEENIVDANAESINGRVLSKEEISQRRALISGIRKNGYEQTIDEVAYTWFNRFCALRFMEVNKYLPSRVRVFTDVDGAFDPQILKEALHIELPGLNKNKVIELKQADKNQELYKYLIITQCNALNDVLPHMFQRLSDYTELLFPENILLKGSVVEQLVTTIPEDNWKDAVQIIGWLYQYYNSVPKDKVFANLKKNIKIKKEDIPAATQLFTPDWIVRYMVENSLGRIFVDHRKNEGIYGDGRGADEMTHSEVESERIAKEKEIASEMGWKYFLPEAEQDEEVRKQLDAQIADTQGDFNVKEIKVIDPCMGSGHILVYAFDVLMKIYMERGYAQRDAVKSIIENNLYGLDIDDRAAQLAYFAVMMVAVKYDNRFLTRDSKNIPQPNVYSIVESNHIDSVVLESFINGDKNLQAEMDSIVTDMHNAKEYGSIIDLKSVDFDALFARFDEVKNEINMYTMSISDTLLPMVKVAFALAQKYDVVVTNPPYMGSGSMDNALSTYVKKYFPDSKSDLFAVFIERCGQMVKKNCYQAMITQHAWMFLSSFEKLRNRINKLNTVNMAHLGARAFEEIGGEVVQTTAFVIRKETISHYRGNYVRLVDFKTQDKKKDEFLSGLHQFICDNELFTSIPNNVVAYWIGDAFRAVFDFNQIKDYGTACIGMRTGDNERFLRFWTEIDTTKMGILCASASEAQNDNFKWIPYCKGGSFRKWYGNNDYVVNWENNGYEIKENTKKVYPQLGDNLGWKISNENFYFHKGITWSGVGATVFGVRCYPQGMIFDSGANAYFVNEKDTYYYFAGLLNAGLINDIIKIINPTINTGCGVVALLPAKYDESCLDKVSNISSDCVKISKIDWDSFETSWDYKKHPLIAFKGNYEEATPTLYEDDLQDGVKPVKYEKGLARIAQAYEAWERFADNQFQKLKANEEELNRIFIDIYGLQDELTPEVEDKDVTVRKADLPRDIKSFISYAVGCMFGRYALDVDGLVYAGGEWDSSKYKIYPVDTDNIIPICDDEYFDDDIVGRFVKFVSAVYGEESLNENLRFIADALGGKGSPKEVIRGYFLNDFYADHLKIYQKRPIYWLFDSGKKGGFKALIYMHRYQPDTIARMRTDYVHEQQARYRTAITDLEHRINDAGTSERVKLQKELTKLQDQDNEIRTYEEKIHHLADQMIRIDLDDGVKKNYEIFKNVLAKI